MDMYRTDGSNINDGINENTYKMLFKDNHNLSTEEAGSVDNNLAFLTIDYFTKVSHKKLMLKFLKLCCKGKDIDLNRISFNEETKNYEYKDKDFKINFNKISDIFKFEETIVKELVSKKRYGNCHIRAISFSPGLKNSKIVTGYITIGKQKIIHSIIEVNRNNKDIIFDWTSNTAMLKEQYFSLTKFQQLSSFESALVEHDFEIMDQLLLSDIGCKAYVIFRDELIHDIEKRIHLSK